MTGLIRKATLLAVGALLVAGVAAAGVPNSATSTVPPVLFVKGNGAEGTSIMVFTIKDANSVAVANAPVVINFAACYDQMKLCNAQGAGLTVDCTAKTVTGTTDGVGQVTFRLAGAPVTGVIPTTPVACASLVVGGQPFPNLQASAYNVSLLVGNTAGGVDAGDLASMICKILGVNCPGAYDAGFDVDRNGALSAADLSFTISCLLDGSGVANCATLCP